MTVTTRGLARQELRRANKRLWGVAVHIWRVYNTYKDVRPDIATPLEEVLRSFDACSEIIFLVHEAI